MASCHGEELVEKALGTALVHGKGGSRYEQPWSTVRARPVLEIPLRSHIMDLSQTKWMWVLQVYQLHEPLRLIWRTPGILYIQNQNHHGSPAIVVGQEQMQLEEKDAKKNDSRVRTMLFPDVFIRCGHILIQAISNRIQSFHSRRKVLRLRDSLVFPFHRRALGRK